MQVRIPSPSLVSGMATQWRDALKRSIGASRQVSVLFSGGLDSSLVATGARDLAEVELVTIGASGSLDLIAAEQGARILGLPWKGRTVDREDVERVLSSEVDILARASPVPRAVLVGIALALETATHTRVLCGQGADELFLGYAHFEGLTTVETKGRRQEDVDRLLLEDWPHSVTLGGRRRKDLSSPFLEPEFMEHVLSLSIDQLRSGGGRKPLLRAVAALLGVPPELAERPKKAFQYGSGVARLLRSRPGRE
ncbi:MAG: asparagine synthase-related protein [Thermoplasmata archaeon]